MVSKSGAISLPFSSIFTLAQPSRPDAYKIGKSNCSSVAPNSIKRLNTSSTTSLGRIWSRSILLITTIGRKPSANALRSTKRVCGMGPSTASTISIAPSTIRSTRSTSLPKSACPGVSTILMVWSLYLTEVHLAKMVIPRSRSKGLESKTVSWASSSLTVNCPASLSKESTTVVLPWSTCAMIATLRTSERVFCIVKKS